MVAATQLQDNSDIDMLLTLYSLRFYGQNMQ